MAEAKFVRQKKKTKHEDPGEPPVFYISVDLWVRPRMRTTGTC